MKMKEKNGDIIFYNSPSGDIKVNVLFQNENAWLTQKAIAKLFEKDRSVITKHIKNIFESGGNREKKQCAKNAHCKF